MSYTKKIWFIIFNGIQAVVAGFMFYLLLVTIHENYSYSGNVNSRQAISTLLFLFLISTASYNLFLGTKYQEGVVQKRFSWPLSILSLCYNGVIAILIVLIMCYGAYEEFFSSPSSDDITGKIMVFVIAAWSILSIIIFVWQLQLIKKIKHTNELLIESLINLIGTEPQNKI